MNIPYVVSWNITNTCNLSCEYCNLSFRENSSELNFLEVKKIIDILSDNQIFMISFSGGEPLYRKDFFEILQYCKIKGIKSLIASNGILLNDYTLDLLIDCGVSAVAITLDSFEIFRNDKNRGHGSYESAMKAINLINKSILGLIISITINKDNIFEFPTFLRKAKEIGAERVKVQVVVEEKKDNYRLSLNRDELNYIKNETQKYISEYCDLEFITFSCDLGYMNTKESTFKRGICNVGRRGIIQSNGDVIFCELYPKWILGNLLKENLNDIWKRAYDYFDNIDRLYLDKCLNCKSLESCMGGCKRFSVDSSLDSNIFTDINCIKMI